MGFKIMPPIKKIDDRSIEWVARQRIDRKVTPQQVLL